MKHYYICVAVLLVSALLIVVPVSAQADTVCALETCTITLPSYFYYSCYNGSYDSVALDAVGKTAEEIQAAMDQYNTSLIAWSEDFSRQLQIIEMPMGEETISTKNMTADELGELAQQFYEAAIQALENNYTNSFLKSTEPVRFSNATFVTMHIEHIDRWGDTTYQYVFFTAEDHTAVVFSLNSSEASTHDDLMLMETIARSVSINETESTSGGFWGSIGNFFKRIWNWISYRFSENLFWVMIILVVAGVAAGFNVISNSIRKKRAAKNILDEFAQHSKDESADR